MSTILYTSELSPYGWRVKLACLLKRIELETLEPPGGSGSEEYKKITPVGKIPAMMENGVLLVESAALMEYIEDRYLGTLPRLRPDDIVERARVRAIIDLFDQLTLKPLQEQVFAQLMAETPDPAAAAAGFDALSEELKKLVHYFDDSGYMVGNQFTIADSAVAPFAFLIDFLSASFEVKSPTQRVPRFRDWWEKVSDMPEVQVMKERMTEGFKAWQAQQG